MTITRSTWVLIGLFFALTAWLFLGQSPVVAPQSLSQSSLGPPEPEPELVDGIGKTASQVAIDEAKYGPRSFEALKAKLQQLVYRYEDLLDVDPSRVKDLKECLSLGDLGCGHIRSHLGTVIMNRLDNGYGVEEYVDLYLDTAIYDCHRHVQNHKSNGENYYCDLDGHWIPYGDQGRIEAIESLQPLCEFGFSDICMELASISRSSEAETQFIRQACTLGSGRGCYKLAQPSRNNGAMDLSLLNKACELNHSFACTELVRKSLGNKEDQMKALKVLEQECISGNTYECGVLARSPAFATTNLSSQVLVHHKGCHKFDLDSCKAYFDLFIDYMNGRSESREFLRGQCDAYLNNSPKVDYSRVSNMVVKGRSYSQRSVELWQEFCDEV